MFFGQTNKCYHTYVAGPKPQSATYQSDEKCEERFSIFYHLSAPYIGDQSGAEYCRCRCCRLHEGVT